MNGAWRWLMMDPAARIYSSNYYYWTGHKTVLVIARGSRQRGHLPIVPLLLKKRCNSGPTKGAIRVVETLVACANANG